MSTNESFKLLSCTECYYVYVICTQNNNSLYTIETIFVIAVIITSAATDSANNSIGIRQEKKGYLYNSII